VSNALHECQEFLAAIFNADDVIEFRTLKPVTKNWGTPAGLPAIVEKLQQLNAQGAQCYFGANPRKKAGESKEDGVALARCLFVDFDGGVEVEEAWSKIKSSGLPMPTATLASGGGTHCWWRLSEPVSDRVAWSARQKALAQALCSDQSVHDWPRIMRLPGFVNTKYEHKPVADLVDVDAGRVYAFSELKPATRAMSDATRAFIDRGDRAPGVGRRDAMFSAACDLRDRGWTPDDAETAIMPRMRQCSLSEDDLADCPRQIRNAWSREPRLPLTPSTAKASSTSSPIEAWRPFPTPALPKAVSTLIEEAARAIGCDEAFVSLPLLAVLGSAIGTTRRVELKPGWSALPIVWPVTVAESGSQKSPAADVSLDHVREREDRLYEEYATERQTYEIEVEDYEKARSTWRHAKKNDDPPPTRPREPVQRRVLVEDATIEALVSALADNGRGLLVATDEFSGLLGSMGRYNGSPAADEALYLKAYHGRSHNVSRRTGRSIHVRQAAVWLTGTIQPGVLRRALGVERRESGLLARLLLAAPPRRPKKWTTDAIGWTTRGDFVRVLDNLYGLEHDLKAGRAETKIVKLSRDAETLFVRFHDEHNVETIELTGDLAAAWSKLEETAGRLALIVHQTRLAAGEHVVADEIDAGSMAAAIRLTDWFKYETRRVYALLAEGEVERAVRQADDRLAAFVIAHGGSVAVRDVIAGVRSIADADAAEEALQRLVDAGRGRWESKPPTDQGGRPGRLFVLTAEAASAQPPKTAGKTGSADADASRRAERQALADEEYVEI
jgi:hypothetical protein